MTATRVRDAERCVRDEYLSMQEIWLAPWAMRAAQSQGRETPMPPCALRNEFQRDRDRILHSKSFRRLTHKTQVFIAPEGDHYRTRLTHTLEVAQIARTLARCLRLNEDLTEAIALGHDLGHTPFGHMGERCLQKLSPHGFAHHEQSLRVVERLENGKGLNLCWEVRDGIVNHRTRCTPATLEGAAVRVSDKIAYVNHDIDDALRAGLIVPSDIPPSIREALGDSHGARINAFILDCVTSSQGHPCVSLSPAMQTAMAELTAFLQEHVYFLPQARHEEEKAFRLISCLYDFLLTHPDKIPGEYQRVREREGVERAACDYIAGMTDRYVIRLFNELYVPSPWD